MDNNLEDIMVDDNKKVNDESNKAEHKHKKESKEKELIDALNLKIKELEDKNIRVTAEMINSNRRKDEECNRLLKYKDEDLICNILPVIDNFERALMQSSKDQNIVNYQKGFNMIYESLKNILSKFEVKEIECLGLEFDPGFHQAVMTDHIEGKKDNEIIEVMQKGYIYKDKVIRPAMVKVNK